ncbi:MULTISPECIES: YihY/virulence factor BrkB family protein [Geomonas]|uniref:YihY/virulence factor BrkB family protein n=2 Tax=Geomonas TaxID=2651583 RepID=A0ABS0YIK3_9BACT|nr:MULTISPECIES: YihY/virulence factor BrkB family protein [Geomonas]MBJ6752076.1 YihY/virulence factor BrkB family protein [Geomonas anaerohicana]QWV92425.1 YihY/virulence factor BrkB family protein [Geomonas oryzisoli]
MNKRQHLCVFLNLAFVFLLQVLRSFQRNQGLLLSGAVAYYTLLSIVPMSILALVVLTHFIEEQRLIHTMATYLEMVIPGYAATLTEQVRIFLKDRKVIGMVGFTVMLFFSSLAFSMFRNAMSVIFSQSVRIKRRNVIISVIIPYLFIFLMGLGIVLVSYIVGAIETLESRHLEILGRNFNLGGTAVVVLYILGIVGEVLLLTALYLVMPMVRVRFRHAIIGGLITAILWEITRRVLVWYYASISMVNIIYGSIALTVVALLSMEAVALILLLGAQVIAELERKSDASAGEVPPEFET